MPFRDYPILSVVGQQESLSQIISLRRDDQFAIRTIEQGKLRGRDRTGVRTTPANATDTAADDVQGDTLYSTTGNYQYTLIDVSGTLKWDRRATDTAW